MPIVLFTVKQMRKVTVKMINHVRTFIFVTYLITNCFIVAGVIRHWDDTVPVIELHTDTPVRVQQRL